MELMAEKICNDRYFPQSYLIIPFYTGYNEDDYDFYTDYFNKCNTDNNKHWKHSRIFPVK